MRTITCSWLSLLAACPLASAAVWTGAVSHSWNDAPNWDTGAVPSLVGGDAAVISNGDAVEYPAADLGDLIIDNGGSLTVSALSAWSQFSTHWTQINNGLLSLNASSFNRPGGNLVVSAASHTEATLSLIGGSVLSLGGELWLGHNTNKLGHVAAININGSSILASGAVGLWAWDYNDEGNSLRLNFSGPAGSSIEVADRIGLRASGEGANNQATWEEFWAVGILTAEGQSGLTGGVFGDYFTTSGTSAADSIAYTLTYTPAVPEPAAGLLLLSVAGLGLRRRR